MPGLVLLQLMEGEAGGLLLSLLLGRAFGHGEGFGVGSAFPPYFHGKDTLVVGAGLADKPVLGTSKTLGLEPFLERRFVVADGVVEVLAGRVLGAGKRSDKYLGFDEAASSLNAAVEVERSDKRFDCVREERDVGAAGVLLGGVTEAEPAA